MASACPADEAEVAVAAIEAANDTSSGGRPRVDVADLVKGAVKVASALTLRDADPTLGIRRVTNLAAVTVLVPEAGGPLLTAAVGIAIEAGTAMVVGSTFAGAAVAKLTGGAIAVLLAAARYGFWDGAG